MAPHSDVDIAFITADANAAPWCEQVIEAMLYLLWDLGLKVGHSAAPSPTRCGWPKTT
jgi:[protein-PII] uridylyltransferase